MTEQNQSTDAVETKPTAPQKSKSCGWVGNTLSIAISLAIGIGGFYIYYHGKQQNAALIAENNTLQQQIASLMEQQSTDKQNLDAKIQTLETSLKEQIESQNHQLDERVGKLQTRVSSLSNSDIENWRLAQASSLVKMAGYKIWSEQDVTTAIALLEDADRNIAEMGDPSLIHARKAIRDDINTLTKIQQTDLEGIILALNQLSNQVDNLPLIDRVEQGAPMEKNNREITASLSDWNKNLRNSLKSFMDNFITITPRDNNKAALLAPNQDIYLRENIRSKLLIAVQAVPRQQEEIYKKSLESVGEWVRAYFDNSVPDTESFLSSVDSLEARSLSITLPEQLESQQILSELVRKRIYNLPGSEPATPKNHAEAQSEPEPKRQTESETQSEPKHQPPSEPLSGQAETHVEES
ncbi:uroporphyrinogen-III C-methyltransferase [Xenorhabdus szentirmaii]|uniref:Uroporphyrinogen-III C-methyltransferase n=2 Tax=Xenorhabdus szentirmaii TaxID=290112 RepID=W1J4N4_9GAMM|nr:MULTISPECIES: uroporphyrinogen-III C-methyltransferase [Xenorhabdus]MBD2780768.1 uroporphyrinogen-III C-methyltransferase [Xenorhabdus sp. 38]MBD2791865.1 uroporphyrinogen-III C-methyltransferase [Xenorhabdus sp. CUL]MBD2800637.1 uroporphyrinogen-III C-methyltransferase [Xenorhabdus sp. M]MBD2803774.1 uroporphyrinogen-III C-methyltransferase [Xenorhabdus sp. ZM]MBD2819683.1 uroporphyrinogen-III C-methyltransferase [Xenorhabdus sp. 42]